MCCLLFVKLKKSIDDFYNKYRECETCNTKLVLKRYYINKDRIFYQRRDKCARFKDLDNRLKTLEDKISVNNNLS